MYFSDSKILLEDVLKYKFADSMIVEYKKSSLINKDIISNQKSKINLLKTKNNNLDKVNTNLNLLVTNKEEEFIILKTTIEAQRKEIKRQKRQKVFGFIGSGVLIVTGVLISN